MSTKCPVSYVKDALIVNFCFAHSECTAGHLYDWIPNLEMFPVFKALLGYKVQGACTENTSEVNMLSVHGCCFTLTLKQSFVLRGRGSFISCVCFCTYS